MTPDEFDYWNGKVLEARRGQLEVVRKAATAWTGLLTAILGVFGTATFVTGLPGLDQVTGGLATALRIGVIVIALALLLSVVTAGLAASSFPRTADGLTANALRIDTKATAKTSLALLKISLISGIVAAVALVLGSASLVFSTPEPSAKKPPLILVTNATEAKCGVLTQSPDGTLTVSGLSLAGATRIAIVEACPTAAQ